MSYIRDINYYVCIFIFIVILHYVKYNKTECGQIT